MSSDPNEPEGQEELGMAVKRVMGVFLLTLFGYITLFGACQIQRRKGGPWALTFDETNGTPVLTIQHAHRLAAGPVRLLFPGERPERQDLPITAVFTSPTTNRMPFGPILFVDTTVLPGTVTLNAFGHVVEIVPRTLFLDLKETPWIPGTNITLSAATKPPASRLQVPGQEWRGR